MKRRILSVLTALSIVLTLLPTAAMAHWVVDEDNPSEQPESAKFKVEYVTSGGTVTRYYNNGGNDDWGGSAEAPGDHFWDPITVMQDDPALTCTEATITLFEDITLTDTTILVNRNVDVTIMGNGHTISCILTGQQGNDPGSAHVAGQDAISIPGGEETNSLTLDNVNIEIKDTNTDTKDTQGIYNDGTLVLQNGATVTVSGVNQNGINGGTGTLEMSGEGTKITVSDVGGSAVKSESITMSGSASIDVQSAAYHGVSVTTLTAGDTSSITTENTTGGYGVYASSSIVLNGSAGISAENTSSEEKEIRVGSSGTFTMNSDGTITGKVSLSTGAKVEGDNKDNVPVLEGTAQVGETAYFTLSEALTAAEKAEDKTVILLKSTTIATDEIADDVTLVVPSGLVLTIEDKASLTVNGTLQADGKNVVGASDAAKIVLGAGGSFTDGGTPVVTDAVTYVWGYLSSENLDADVANGQWKTEEDDVVSTTEYWQAKVAASKESDGTYKPTWEALRNLKFFCYDYIGTNSAYTDYADRITAIQNFITSIDKLDMSDKAITSAASSDNTGILEKYTGLTELNLANTGLTEYGGVEKLTNLKVLNLSDNPQITSGGALQSLTALTSLDISGTGITDLNFMWRGTGDSGSPAFSALTTLTAKNLNLTSITGLVEIAKKNAITADTRWDLSGSTLTDNNNSNEGFAHLKAVRDAFAAAGASFKEPSYQATSGSNVAEFNGKLYGTLEAAISAAETAGGTVTVITTTEQSLKTAIPANVTLLLPNNTSVKIEGANLSTVFVGSKGAIQVDAGGTLNIPAASGGSEDFVGKDNSARLNLSSGSVLFDIGSRAVTLKAGARAEIPTGKKFFLLMQAGVTEKDRVPLNGTIEAGAVLTVNGTLILPSLETGTGSSLTVNGTVDATDGTVDLGKQASVTVGNGGTVKLNGANDLLTTPKKILGTATVQSGGTLIIASQEMVGSNGNLKVTGGQVKLDMGALDERSGKIIVTLENAQVEIPDGKQWTTVIGQDAMRINMDVVINNGSTLTVSGKAGSGDNKYGFRVAKGSTVTLNGSIRVASGAIMDISSEGTIAGSGSISAAGTVNYNAEDASKLDCTITLQSGAQVNGKADISDKLVNAQKTTTAVSGYTHSWIYKTPITPPPVNPGDNTGSTGGSSSGGSSSSGDYLIGVDQPHGGSIRVTPGRADKGDTVTITAIPDDGYELGSLTVTDQNGSRVPLSNEGNGKYTFTMPGSRVSVTASFVPFGQQTSGFYDVPAGSYYADAVQWAVEQGITTGTTATTFSPNAGCTRAQIVTFLWRANGSPAPSGSVSFSDVSAGSYYADAVQWAVEQGITSGTTATTFSPNATCTRAQAATFLWRAEGSPAAGSSSFSDVADDAYYADAVDWAVANGVTQGITASTFGPNSTCTRAQIVTFLYRAMV